MTRDPLEEHRPTAPGGMPSSPVVPVAGNRVPSGAREETDAREEMPLEDDGTEATGGVRGAHTHDPAAGQDPGPLDRGVDAEHLRSASQGVRPDDVPRDLREDS